VKRNRSDFYEAAGTSIRADGGNCATCNRLPQVDSEFCAECEPAPEPCIDCGAENGEHSIYCGWTQAEIYEDTHQYDNCEGA
jgi:hypothetical protein